MYQLPKVSYSTLSYLFEERFQTGLGFHIPNPVSRALASRIITLTAEPTLQNILLPPVNQDLQCKEYMKMTLLNRNKFQHTVLNVNRQTMYDLEQFFLSVELSLDPVILKMSINVGRQASMKTELYRIPFQQFMLIDALTTMITCSGLGEHRTLILDYIKCHLGFYWLTTTKIKMILQLFSRRIVGHNVRRRMGKSIAVYSDLALCMAFFPNANIRALYTVHKTHAADECHSAVSAAVKRFESIFNQKQLQRYQYRIDKRGGNVDPLDFYYTSKSESFSSNSKVITVYFFKMTRNGICNDGLPVASNTLRCKAYTQINVGINILYSLKV